MVCGSLRWAASTKAGKAVTFRKRGTEFRSAFRVLLVHHIGKLAQVGVKCGQQSLERAPANVAPAALDAREVGGGEFRTGCQFVLCQSSASAQNADRVADVGLSGTYHIVKVAWRPLAAHNIAQHSWRPRGSDRRAPWHRKRELPAQRTPYRRGHGVHLAQSSPFGASK